MNFVSSAWKAIKEDNLLKKIIRNTGYMLTARR
jgi:hypothetical protein